MSRSMPHAGAVAVLGAGLLALAACSGGTVPPTGVTPTTVSSTRVSSAPPGATGPAGPGPWVPPSPTATACAIPRSLLGRPVEVLPTNRKVVALTFDSGGSSDGVTSVLATLAREHVPATFFLTSDFVDRFPALSRDIAAHPVGNQTYDSPDLTALTDSGIRTEIRSAAARIEAVTGRDPRPLLRFPDGALTAHLVGLVNAECYVPFRWTVDSLGWQGVTGGQSVDSVVRRVLAGARPGEIVLLRLGAHPEDHSTLDADALPGIIAGLRAGGYGFVTLTAALR